MSTESATLQTLSGPVGEPDEQVIAHAPSTDRGRRALMTWSAGLVYSAITIAVGFVATPLLLRFLGPERLGAARSAGEWFSYVLLADLGLSGTIALLLSRAQPGGPARVWSFARFGIRLQTLSLLALVPASLVLAWCMPWLIRVPPELRNELRLASLLSVAGMLAYPFSVHRILLEVSQRGYLVNLGLTGHSLIWTGLGLLLAWAGWGLIGQSVASVAAGLAFAGFSVVAARIAVGRLRPPPATVPLRDLFRDAWPISVNNLARRLMLSSDMILVGLLLGASAVTVLFVTQRLIVLASGQINSIANASWPGLAEMRRTGEQATFERRVCEVIRLIIGLNLAVAGAAAAINPHFVRLWVGKDLYGGDLLTVATVLAGVALGTTALFSLLMDLSGCAKVRLPAALASGVIKLALALFLVPHLGVAGVVAGYLAAWLATESWYYPRLLVTEYSVRAKRVLGAAVTGAVIGGIWWFAMTVALRVLDGVNGWSAMIGLGALVAVATALYCWSTLVPVPERTEWRRRVM